MAEQAGAKSGDVIRQGACSGTSNWKLKLSPQNGKIEVEYEVDSNHVGQTWKVRLFENGNQIFAGNRVTRIVHRVFIPEDWERADQARESARSTLSLASGLALALAVLVGLVLYWRRTPVLEPMQWPSRARMNGSRRWANSQT